MKPLILAAGIGITLAGLPAASMAACAAPSVRVPNLAKLTELLQGNTVCVPTVTQPTMEWQELHQVGGDLVDYKRGPGHSVDPSKKVGTWTVGEAPGRSGVLVTHNYGGASIYTYSVWDNKDGTYSFCSVNPEVKARIKSGGGAC